MAEGKRTLQIVEPCPAAWGEMSGTAERRHCDHCDKAVHNLSEMSPEAAAELLEHKEPVCVRVRCSADGTVVHNVPPEKRAARQRLQLLVTPALLAAMATCRTEPDLSLVVEGPPATAPRAPFVAPVPAPAVEQSEPVASAEPAANFEPRMPAPSHFVMGARVLVNEQPSPMAPEPAPTKPRPAKAGRAAGPKARATQKHPERPRPDWLIERDDQPQPERDSELECMGFCM